MPPSSNARLSFFDEVNRIADPNYIPIESDVLRARTKTTGIYETRFTMGQLSIQYVLCVDEYLAVWANVKLQHVRCWWPAK